MEGILIIDKPKGYTSQDVVSIVKKTLNIKKAGHAGTLDPMATGILPIMIGNSTKLSKYLINHSKIYAARIKLGQKTSTGDSEGEVIEEKTVNTMHFSEFSLQKVLFTFMGKRKQTPPKYSAIKVKGKKLYEYAREGKEVEIPEREIEIYDISLMNFDTVEQEIEFIVSCSKGTYIRSLCEEIAEKLGTVGHMMGLRRLFVEKFTLDDAITMEDLLLSKEQPHIVKDALITMEEVLSDFLPIQLENKRKLELFLNGVQLTYDLEDGVYNIYDINRNYIGTGIIKNKLLKRDVIL